MMDKENRPLNEEEIKEEERKKIPPSADDTNRERSDSNENGQE